MPDAADGLDLQRFHELRRLTDMGANLWAALQLAAERGDAADCKYLCEQLTVVTRSTLTLVKRLGNPEPDTPFARDAKAWREHRDATERSNG